MIPSLQLPLHFQHRPSLSGDDFIVAPCNSEAIQWIDRWPKWPDPIVALTGPRGCGKSHLVNVFSNIAKPYPIVINKLEYALRRAMKVQTAFVIDNAEEKLCMEVEELFLHFINVLKESGGHLLIASSNPPGRWKLTLPDLASRLRAVQVVSIGMPDDRLVAALLVKLFSDRQLRIDLDVIKYLLPRIDRSFEGIQKQVSILDSTALHFQRKITVPFVRQILDKKQKNVDDQKS